MTIKRLLALLLALITCFMFVACAQVTDENAPEPALTPLLYRVTDENDNTVWLFGSVHVGREEFHPLPDYVMNAYKNSDALAVELDMNAFEKDYELQVKALMPLIYKDGSKISDHIPEELYKKAVAALEEHNLYMGMMDLYKPSLWSNLLESSLITQYGGDAALGIDKKLLDMAYEDNKEILEIESAEAQYKMLADFDEDVQLMLLESAVESNENKEEFSADLNELMDLWAEGDEQALSDYINAEDDTITPQEKLALEKYNKAMITDRNYLMADFAQQALESGKEVFICVGAAHVVGDGAMADLLNELGYDVECVSVR